MAKKSMTYASTGVNYDVLDPFKREAQHAAASTEQFVKRFGFRPVSWTRGESVRLISTPIGYIAFVVEGLGTKSIVADDLNEAKSLAALVSQRVGQSYYDNLAQCNVAMCVNDMITLGALPVSYGQYLAVGNSTWFSDVQIQEDIIAGTAHACHMAKCEWGGGETPTLGGIIVPGRADLAGASWGIIKNKKHLINPANIRPGDAIVMVESSGIHANGLTLARKIAEKLPDGYLAKLDDGRTYGETLLDPTHIYVRLIEACQKLGIKLHYVVNITGHGWRKLMRAPWSLTYVIDDLPPEKLIFDFIQRHGPVDDREAYGNLNMGAGLAIYVPEKHARTVVKIARSQKLHALIAGHVEKGERRVVIPDKDLEFKGDTLGVR